MSPRRQLGLLWGFVAAALVAAAPLAPRLAAGLPACPLHRLTGLPCPSCGATRAALALARLDLLSAFSVSPLAAAGWVGLVGGGLLAGLWALGGRELPALPALSPRQALGLRCAVVAGVLANWLYLVYTGA